MKLQIMSVQFASFPDQSFQLSKIPYSHFLSPSNFKSTIKIQLIFLPSKSDVAKKLHEIPFSLFKHCNQINSSRNLRVTSQLVKIQKSHAFLLLLTFPRDRDSQRQLSRATRWNWGETEKRQKATFWPSVQSLQTCSWYGMSASSSGKFMRNKCFEDTKECFVAVSF